MMRATLRMRSASATEVPPNFCTMSAMYLYPLNELRVGSPEGVPGEPTAPGGLRRAEGREALLERESALLAELQGQLRDSEALVRRICRGGQEE